MSPLCEWRLSPPQAQSAWSLAAITGSRQIKRARSCRYERVNAAFHSNAATSAASTSYGRDAPAPYRWSWQDDDEPAVALELDASAVAAASNILELTAVLRAAAADAPPRAALTTPSRTLVAGAARGLLSATAVATASCTVGDAARLLEAYGAVTQATVAGAADANAATGVPTGTAAAADAPPPRLVSSVLSNVCGLGGAGGAVQSCAAGDLADLLWALSELQDDELPWEGLTSAAQAPPSSPPAAEAAQLAATVAAEAPAALQRAVLARLVDQDFLAPDLCRVVCALGGLTAANAATGASTTVAASVSSSSSSCGSCGNGFVADPTLVKALNEEVRYQLTEFAADFDAADLGRLISGMAGLRLGVRVATDEEYRRILMKAVYGKTRSIADKASVDFALSRLLADDPEARSMHYDSRWTHEELRWLPRRERDKRRILKEGWYRTKWGGWSPGGGSGA